MAPHYNLGWLRQEENQYLSLPPDEAAKLPIEIRKLIGYDFGGPYLGFVEEGNPLVLTDAAIPRNVARGSTTSGRLFIDVAEFTGGCLQ